jgi:hypothetical protein
MGPSAGLMFYPERCRQVIDLTLQKKTTGTSKVFPHLMKPINQETACRLENAFFDTNGSKMVAVN